MLLEALLTPIHVKCVVAKLSVPGIKMEVFDKALIPTDVQTSAHVDLVLVHVMDAQHHQLLNGYLVLLSLHRVLQDVAVPDVRVDFVVN